MKIILLRHGQTKGNYERRYIGKTDERLSEEGVLQAKNAGVFPKVGAVYVSPMIRARETAGICFPNACQIVVDAFRETDFGDFEGKTADEMAQDSAYREWVDGYCQAPCPNGESVRQVLLRVCQGFSFVVADAGKKELETAIIVAHGGTIMSLLSHLTGDPDSYYRWQVKNGKGYVIELEGGRLCRSPSFFEVLPLR